MNKAENISSELHNLGIKYSQLSWTRFTTSFDFGVNKAYEEMITLLKNTEYYDYICSLLDNNMDDVSRRKLLLLKKEFDPFHKSEEINALQLEINKKVTKLSQILNTHRCVFEGREVSAVELSQILKQDSDRNRRKKAYMAKNQVNKPLIDAGFLDLVKMRKKLAKLNGFDNFVDYKLDEAELESTTFDSWKKELSQVLPKIKEIREKIAMRFLNDTKIYPWDEQFVTAKLAPSLNTPTNMSTFHSHLVEFFNQFGIDLASFNITYDVFPRINKSEWGYNFGIETGKDSRILANVKDLYSEYGVLLHESGHGIHSFLLKPEDIMINRGVSGIISEGIANLFQSFMLDSLFYKQFFDDSVADEFKELQQFQYIDSFRAIFRIFFDQQFYKEDLSSLEDVSNMYWRLYKELLDEEPFCDNPPWAFTIHHTTHPIYLHNYFMGDVTCTMLKKVFKQKYNVAKISEDPKVFGQFIIDEVISPSGLYKFNELFERISGDKFRLDYLLD
ncbi:M3 family metallopeptidase [Clostridiaceae bacterium M8S5]|nr:M3 family metallopeptidase [Clostridiaceae bacterium M8S5]